MATPALLALEDGTLFHGASIGACGQSVGEVVFNTAMTGYQEILTDPSYCRQIITLTYPHIGNVGANAEDEESARVYASGLVVRDLPAVSSSWRAQESLGEYLVRHGVVAIADIDTRQLTRVLREKGAQSGCITAAEVIDESQALSLARDFPGLSGMDLAREVSTDKPYCSTSGTWQLDPHQPPRPSPPRERRSWKVVAYDFGTKRNILRMLVDRGCEVIVVPAQTPAERALTYAPDGIFLSNGPGDPQPCDYAIESIREFIALGIPLFGICLGHQLLALAGGARTEKMKFGHHGANHPVQDLDSSRVFITSQNHGFAVDERSLPNHIRATHRSLFDGSLQGLHFVDRPAFGFQGHPEASPGPHETGALFDHFVALMGEYRCVGGCPDLA